jgi:3D (Asp-Asp-Asp) domain-containing protein
MTPIRWIVVIILCLGVIHNAQAEELWKITSYCSCTKCCGKSDGITASGKQAEYGYVACNWLPFGTLVEIEDLGLFSVQDRGAKSLFGSKKNHIKHLDVYLPSHAEARVFGVVYKKVTIIK